MNGWNAIDLHMHTVVGITGDGKCDDVKNFTYLNYIRSIHNFDLKLVAITNHNYIDISNYILCRYLAKKIGCNVLFGVEIDTDREDGKNYHFVMIFNEPFKVCFEITYEINDSTKMKKKSNKVRYTPEEIVNFIKKYNLVIIPHGDKSKGILHRPDEFEIIDALKKVREGFIRVFDNPSDWKMEEIKQFVNSKNIIDNIDEFGGVLFSDNRDWLNYELKFRKFYMNAEPTFKGFLHSITNPTERFATKDSIPHYTNYISMIEINELNSDSRIKASKIELKSGYNCIIGKSGSGKSLLIHILKKYLCGIDDNKNYSFLENNEIKIFNENSVQLNKSNVNVGVGESIFQKIISASSTSEGNDMYPVIELLSKDFVKQKTFSTYIENYKKQIKKYVNIKNEEIKLKNSIETEITTFVANNQELKKMKDVISFSVSVPDEEKETYSESELSKLNIFKDKLNELRDIVEILKNKKKELIFQKILEIENLYNDELLNIYNELARIRFRNQKIKIVKKSFSKVNYYISRNAIRKQELTESVSQSINYIINNLKKYYIYKKQIENFNFSIDISKINRVEKIDGLDGVSITEKIVENDVTKLDIKSNNIFNTRGIQSRLESKIYDMTNQNDSKAVIDLYYRFGKLDDNAIEKIFSDTKLNVDVYFDGQNVKQLNPGDISKKYINLYFKKELANGTNSIILYDQIENDVDKTFINDTILELIKELQSKAQVIIVTHDPIVAVNADPINYIEAIKDNDNKIIYRNFIPESEFQDELNTIAKNVDGSKNVIKERYEIYRGEKYYVN